MKFQSSIFCLVLAFELAFSAGYGKDPDGFITHMPNINWDQELRTFIRCIFSIQGIIRCLERPWLLYLGDRSMLDDSGKLIKLQVNTTMPSPVYGNVTKFYAYALHNGRLVERNLTMNGLSLTENSDIFDANRATVFITHGYMSSKRSESCTLIRNAYLKYQNVNVIVIDWSYVATTWNYLWAVEQIQNISLEVARMVEHMKKSGLFSYDQVTFVGHSLGAHLMGIVGYRLSGRIGYVVGLDPAFPLFYFPRNDTAISKASGNYVKILHTNAGALGTPFFLGHADIIVNDGILQRNCPDPMPCSALAHLKAYEYYAESIERPHHFGAIKCTTYTYQTGTCVSPREQRGSFKVMRDPHGIFQMPTSDRSPFNNVSNKIEEYLVNKHSVYFVL